MAQPEAQCAFGRTAVGMPPPMHLVGNQDHFAEHAARPFQHDQVGLTLAQDAAELAKSPAGSDHPAD